MVISEPSALNQMSSIGLLTEKKIKPHLVTFSQINDILTSFNSDQIPIKSKEKSNNFFDLCFVHHFWFKKYREN